MNVYLEYLNEIEDRKVQDLDPKPIDSAELLSEIIEQIKDPIHEQRKDSLKFFIYNVMPGTTPAAAPTPAPAPATAPAPAPAAPAPAPAPASAPF